MIENDEIYVIINDANKNQIIGYADSEYKARKFCDNKELSTGKSYIYNTIRSISNIVNDRPKTVTFKAFYKVSKEMITIDDIVILGQNKYYESDWPNIKNDSKNRNYFYFNMEIDNSSSKNKILDLAKRKADELLDNEYKTNNGFMYFINKQILLKEGVIEED